MKKIIIGSLVGTVVMFIWSNLAWMVLPIHANTYMYTPAQDNVLKVLAESNLETGTYGLPSGPTREEMMKAHKDAAGKSGAAIFYVKTVPEMGASMMLVGFIFGFIGVLAACLLLAANMNGTFFSRWWMVMMVAVVVIFHKDLMNWNWSGYSWEYTRDMVLDTALGWAITGVWLSWWFGRK